MPRPDLEEWADRLFVDQWNLAKRKTFSAQSYYLGKKMFAFIYKDSLGIKLDPKTVQAKVASDADVYAHFSPGQNVVMKNWLMITRDEARLYDEHLALIEEAYAAFTKAKKK